MRDKVLSPEDIKKERELRRKWQLENIRGEFNNLLIQSFLVPKKYPDFINNSKIVADVLEEFRQNGWIISDYSISVASGVTDYWKFTPAETEEMQTHEERQTALNELCFPRVQVPIERALMAGVPVNHIRVKLLECLNNAIKNVGLKIEPDDEIS